MSATATVAPGPQYMQALARANEVRLARADLKRRVADGRTSVPEVILSMPVEARNMSVSELLTSQPRWGHTRCRKLLARVPMTENKSIGSMTERQRQALAQLLEQPARASRRDLLIPALAAS